MDAGKIIFEELNKWVYNETNEAGEKLHVIDASDLHKIIPEIVKKLNEPAVVGGSEQLVCECKNPKPNDKGFNWCNNCNRLLVHQ